VQCRVVYLPTSYLYSNRSTIPLNPLLVEIRDEIYLQPFTDIDFAQHYNTVAATDIKRPRSTFLTVINSALRAWEKYLRPEWVRQSSNAQVRDLIRREDLNTDFNDLAPVNKAFHMAVIYFADGKQSPDLIRHNEKISTYLCQSSRGMTSGGTNGLQLWDTAFTVISVVEAGLAKYPEFQDMMEMALSFLDITQFRDDLDDPYRQKRKGGWPFSTKDNGYIVSDCVAEGMKATILLQEEWYDLTFTSMTTLTSLQWSSKAYLSRSSSGLCRYNSSNAELGWRLW